MPDLGQPSMSDTFTSLNDHVIFSTKHREPLIIPPLQADLYPYLAGIVRGKGGVAPAVGGIADRVHLVLQIKADVSISEMARVVKANPSKWVSERPGGRGRFAWRRGCGAFSVGRSRMDAVLDYVQNQQDQHRTRTFQDEFAGFLRRHDLVFDASSLWD